MLMSLSSRARRWLLALLALALLLTLVWVTLRSGPLAPVRVTTVRVATGQVLPELFGIGTVEARRSYLVGPTVAGRVRQVAVDVGERVRAGQLLAEMDPVDLAERDAAQQAALARATSQLAALAAQRQDALARQRLAAANAQRYQALGRDNFISPGGVEARVQELASADAAVAAADASLSAARQDVQRLHAERAGVQRQRALTRLLAPADAVVSGRDAEPGTTVVAGQAVVRLIDPASLWIRLRLDQARSGGLAPGLPARIRLRSHPGVEWPGQVVRLELLGDSVAEERIAQVAFERLPAALAVGELAEVTLALPRPAPSLVLPNASVQHRQGQVGVWRVQAGEPVFAPVRLGAAGLDGQVQVLDGLTAGDEVIVHSEKALAEGSRVRVVPALVERRP